MIKSTLSLLTLWLGVSACGFATTLAVSAEGQFSSSATPTELAAPNGSWSISFDVNSTPAVTNVDLLGFDVPFTNFSYRLNGTTIAATPDSIRFASSSNLGLFTAYFGPESGYDSNGNAIPEFSFSGGQAFSGTTASPTIVPGSYSTDGWTYSDVLNYDDHPSSGGSISITTAAVPEPATAGLFGLLSAGSLALLVRARKLKSVL